MADLFGDLDKAVFQRYLRPEKEHLSFSIIYDNGKRSLDLICKDRVEAEVWFAGLNALITSVQCGRSKIDGWDGGLYFDDSRDLTSNSPSNSSISTTLEISSPETSVNNLKPKFLPKAYSFDNSTHTERSDVALNSINMQVKGSTVDAFRVSVSSAPSTSSHGSAQDDCDALADVYIWGEVSCDSSSRVSTDKKIPPGVRTDILLPRPIESNVGFDVHQIACGVRHAALVNRQGEIFTWGEESGGRLGHGIGADVTQPHIVETLALCNVHSVSCGEFHTCAITVAGELYTWGDGTHNAGLLGHGTDVSHWIPKRVSGPLEGLQVASVTCGTWHTALVTSTGQLFTFGDGTFGVLGHGNRESVAYPKEVESLMGLKTIAVACGVWHTAAVVEVIVAQSSASISSGKLFTWGDGDKNRLGHGDKEPRLKPTCVPSLIDYNFHKIACGHSLTVGLTTSGQVFTMGSTVYGQLGNPRSDGKLPCLVEDKLSGESVEQVACGSYHVAVLTSRNEVYTWGKGANGRLGHGDVEDRKIPTLVEALKDRPVKHIACGSNFTSSICLHKWVPGAEQSQCTICRQTFGFTRKRHNCYNCGLVHCHSCSSRKALGALLSPNPNKPYRVCDSCYLKLNKVQEIGAGNNKKNIIPRLSGESKDRFDRPDVKSSKNATPTNMDLIKFLDDKAAKHGKKSDAMSMIRTPQGPSLMHLKDIRFPNTVDVRRVVPKPILPSAAHSGNSSRAVSPFSRRPSPPRSATPIPTTSGLSFSKNVVDSLKKTNDLLNQEVQRLRAQVDGLKQRCEVQEFELQKSSKKVQEAMTLAAEESAKSKAAKEVIKSLTAQLKEMAERLPLGVYDRDNIRPVYLPNGIETNVGQNSDANGEHLSRLDMINGSHSPSPVSANPTTLPNGASNEPHAPRDITTSNEMNTNANNQRFSSSDWREARGDARLQNGNGGIPATDTREPDPYQTGENVSTSRSPISAGNQVEAEWIEQYEPGVYITLVSLRDGSRDLKRVRFSRRRFGEHQAEAWWSENRERVYEKYNVRGGSDKATSPAAAPTPSALRMGGEEPSPSPHA
ncbi:Ultraviolet-B receptor UVR8 [Acorus calamus]|uniref:Ultraviolet-B receptor UVR8 n=1 Tax=Acorus calamus TaxID=4465 RepID=A0AAV9FAU9_ACOCL|nr:Ultraviolet-B receptor UVR8 [Acorus calamus]